MKNAILIPAYNPDEKLMTLIDELIMLHLPIIVVNDGSTKTCEPIFSYINHRPFVEVIHHDVNKGKGAAIKTGIQHIKLKYPECLGVITADADGQHLPKDVQKIHQAVLKNPASLTLGARNFNKTNIPFKSRFGNKLTSAIFYLTTHQKCQDTQTGLRGLPKSLFDECLTIPGERYEYEMNVLLQFAKDNISFIYEEIETVYIDGNASSHFNPIKDSLKIYFNILKFSLVSLLSSLIDIIIFLLLMQVLGGNLAYKILIATILSRVLSAIFNFMINKLWVFSTKDETVKQGIRYVGLFLLLMILSYIGVSILSVLPLPLFLIKIIVDGSLFLLSYKIQNHFIFKTVR